MMGSVHILGESHLGVLRQHLDRGVLRLFEGAAHSVMLLVPSIVATRFAEQALEVPHGDMVCELAHVGFLL